MNIMGQALLFVIVLVFSGVFLLVIPEALGIKVGLWSARKHFQSESQIQVGKISWREIFACIAAVEVIIISTSALVEGAIPSQRPFFPVYIYKALLVQQLQDPVYVILYSFLMIAAFFIAGFARVLRAQKRRINNS